jgi:hypothetical protein
MQLVFYPESHFQFLKHSTLCPVICFQTGTTLQDRPAPHLSLFSSCSSFRAQLRCCTWQSFLDSLRFSAPVFGSCFQNLLLACELCEGNDSVWLVPSLAQCKTQEPVCLRKGVSFTWKLELSQISLAQCWKAFSVFQFSLTLEHVVCVFIDHYSVEIVFLWAKLTKSVQIYIFNKDNAVLYSEDCWILELDESFRVTC